MSRSNTRMQDEYNKSRADVPEGTRRLQDMVEQSKAKLGEEWSARDVRAVPDMSNGAYVVGAGYVSPPVRVTLEGLAAVIGSLSEALQTLYGSNHETKQTIAALCKAADAVTALLTTEVCAMPPPVSVHLGANDLWAGAPDASQSKVVAVGMEQFSESAMRIAEDAAYNRAITDAHNSMADEFGITSDDQNGVRAQAAIRKLYRRIS